MIGIYGLTWEGSDKVYIGQSVDIHTRYKQHLYYIRQEKSNYKMLELCRTNGMPSLNVVKECSIDELDKLEIEYIKEFNSIEEGVNIAEGGINAVGINNFASKYSMFTVLKIFSRLYNTKDTNIAIAKRLGVNTSIVSLISLGDRHKWLQEKYPDKYSSMLGKRRANVLSTKYPRIKDSNGIIYTLTNAVDFCKEHKDLGILPSHIGAVMRGTRKSHRGFTLVDEPIPTKKYLTLCGPNDEVYDSIDSITEFCKNNEYLQSNPNARKGISRVLNGERPQYMGFKLK